MNTTQISKWLGKNNRDYAVISLNSGVSIPTLYSLASHPNIKRQKRIVEALSNYIESLKVKK